MPKKRKRETYQGKNSFGFDEAQVWNSSNVQVHKVMWLLAQRLQGPLPRGNLSSYDPFLLLKYITIAKYKKQIMSKRQNWLTYLKLFSHVPNVLKNQFWYWMSTSKKWGLILAHNAVRAWAWIRSQKQPNVTSISVAKTVIVWDLNWRVQCIQFPAAKSFILLAMLLPQVTFSLGWVIVMSDTRQPS